MGKSLIFISHIFEEKEIALELKNLIEAEFLGMIEIFVSSDSDSISLGENWLNKILNALKRCVIEIVICSPKSVDKSWINFEAGAGCIRDIPVIPLCHSGMEPADLPFPLKLLQAATATEESSLKQVFPILARAIGANTPDADLSIFISKVKNFELGYRNSSNLISRLTGSPLPEPSMPDLSSEADELLIGVSQSTEGRLTVVENREDMIISTREKDFGNFKDARTREIWKDAVAQLENYRLLKKDSEKKYSITIQGYHVADILKAQTASRKRLGAEDSET